MHKIRWDDLQYIHAVALHGGLSTAARALGVTHSTVLRRIEAVEAAHGVTLFERPPGGYRLRPEGRDLLDALEAMERAASQLSRVLPSIGKGMEGAFRITTTDSLADLIMPRHLVDLTRAHPKLKVDMVVSNTPMDPERPDAQITIRPAFTLPDGLEGARAARMSFAAYQAPDLPPGQRWLGFAPPLTRSPAGLWQEDQPDDQIGYRADSFLTLARMAEEGLGPVYLPKFVGRAAALIERPGEKLVTTNVWIAAHPDVMQTDRTRIVVDFLTAALASDERLGR